MLMKDPAKRPTTAGLVHDRRDATAVHARVARGVMHLIHQAQQLRPGKQIGSQRPADSLDAVPAKVQRGRMPHLRVAASDTHRGTRTRAPATGTALAQHVNGSHLTKFTTRITPDLSRFSRDCL